MAGDPLRDAFRTELDTVIAAASPAILWARKDLLNTTDQPAPPPAGASAAASGWFEIEFPGGTEQQVTFGAPGANLHREQGQVTIRAVTRLRAGKTIRDLAETYMAQVRTGFRMRRFTAGGLDIQVTSTGAMGGGEDEAGQWAESLALAYSVYNRG
ncbi:hypothetical protein [uncultured Reyranella sp.]|uniref:hypothetical protein n=1 Tax=uncultured Reyranella sp. TaxID=735512 RepID=UPI0025E7DA2B|nr:hypothetical protein [uncultured Reyranella sp.]